MSTGAPTGRVEGVQGHGQAAGLPALTPTQTAILERVAQGRTNEDIGAELGISPRTVQVHLGAIYHRLRIAQRKAGNARVLAALRWWGIRPGPA